MRTRVAVAIDDNDFAEGLVSLLRTEGYLVVEPEVADYVVLQVGGQRPGIRINGVSPAAGGWSKFLAKPVSNRIVLAQLNHNAQRRRGTPLRGH